ncbi:MAG: LTA synthase family protein [Erysipelotrichaceae bacterium]|nr:LTA synthase family protein [Erysipelotrichaceae bacterium]
MKKEIRAYKIILFFLFLTLGFSFICAIFYVRRNFILIGTNPISQILFHCIVQIDGADPVFIKGIIKHIIIIPFIVSTIISLFLFKRFSFLEKIQEMKIFSFIRKKPVLISCFFFLFSFLLISEELRLPEFIDTYTRSSTLYEDEYVDPAVLEYTFPEKKRNLIYIILESVETSDYSKEHGGALEYECIPELYELAQENITFNDNRGYEVAPGASWTVASMIAQSSGIPLNIPIGENDFVTSNKYLPGAFSLGEILKKGGYHNELLIGSEAAFSGRNFYYEMHGDYTIHDFDYFVENDLFDYDTRVWWGIIDRYLFEYAKQDLLKLSEEGAPFNLTMLTVDTHHQNGWVCEDCKEEFPDQLANVYACSSRRVYEFVDWCQKQDFYDNTTILIVGDHCSMSADFSAVIGSFERKGYYTLIHPVDGLSYSENRILSTFDFYPTTVSSLGIGFEGNKLGLGVNLFSDEETLCEKYGVSNFFSMVSDRSAYYDNHILYGFE